MPASSPLLVQLPTGRITAAKNKIVDVLKADETLQSVNLTITTYRDGRTESNEVKKCPDVGDLPYLRIGYGDGALKWENEHQHYLTFPLVFTLFTKGTNEDDLTNLFECVMQGLYPQDPVKRAAVFAELRSLEGLSRSNFSHPNAFGMIGYSAHGLTCSWRLQLHLSINT